MADGSYELTTPLHSAFTGLAVQGPRPILDLLTLFNGSRVEESDLVTFIQSAGPNDSGMIQLRLTLAKWDADDNLVVLDEGGNPTSARSEERRSALGRALGLSADAEAKIRLVIPIYEDRITVITREFEPWYDEARGKRSNLYWEDYEKYLAHVKGWPAASINNLDQSTSAVVERLSDPTRGEIKPTRGLVVGYVQSGKTANFTGVIAKAIDAGYRLVIVMTGTIEILRSQTQRRIDMELMGVENVLSGQDPTDPEVAKGLDYQQDEDWLASKFVKHTDLALDQPGVSRIRRVTTHHSDYKSLPQGMSQLRYERQDRQKPLHAEANLFQTDTYVVVIKKNPAPLRKLIKDLRPLQDMLYELPALIIDDESDVASVNTRDPKKSASRTAINKLITELVKIVPRSQYVGYTATPFANVFIDPDDEEDLFPADFVLSLPRPEGYMGVQEFHDVEMDWENTPKNISNSNELAYIRPVEGDGISDPETRKKELATALDAWVLSGAIKKYRETHSNYQFRHHTMLVHEEMGTAGHSDAATVVRALWNTGNFTADRGLRRLQKLFESDFADVMAARAGDAPVPENFETLKPYLAEAIEEMTKGGSDPVLIVNSDKSIQDQQESLDFDKGKVWRVLVGGAKLSRGFTVEGLTVSYFRRKSGQADTLMQAGRWFGFRSGYQDLVRLYIRRDKVADLYEAFESLLMDEDAFRSELEKYAGLDEDGKPLVEPRQIPPLVSQHLPWLKPTARNKMFNAVVKARANVGAFHQLSSVPERNESALHAYNLTNCVLPLLVRAVNNVQLPYRDENANRDRMQSAKLGLISAEEFLDVLDKHVWHPDYYKVVDPLRTFIGTSTAEGKIKDWAIVWPQAASGGRVSQFAELSCVVPIWKRLRRAYPRIDFTGENKRNILSASPVAAGKEVPILGKSDTRGVIVVSVVADVADDDGSVAVDRENLVGLISLRVPDKSIQSKKQLIQYGVVVSQRANDVAV
ncbi:hypothetical protein ASG84_16080 [Rhodococcus sp. Leaf278]|uniref:Z1 domain-containing protein n=1 Tax=Rhodococcus sp. Leaf278 TaxID=1736319 RepID=UPI00070F22D1|nr:Z1 domain-containing protein [Rhodococcus sp. Leaf278]KQU58161.1 hypothetical protein ASG84_16080 [Rhodococcus sp. Leaf278]